MRFARLAPLAPKIAACALATSAPAAGTQAFPARPLRIVQHLSREITAVLQRPALRAKFLAAGTQVHAGSSEDLRAAMADDMARFGKVIRAANIRLD